MQWIKAALLPQIHHDDTAERSRFQHGQHVTKHAGQGRQEILIPVDGSQITRSVAVMLDWLLPVGCAVTVENVPVGG